jgi:hypothetical protein
MHLIAFIIAGLVASGPAAAQTWQEYTYPNYAFAVAFPAQPKIETVSYQASNGRQFEAQVYSVTQDIGVLKMMVADLTDTTLEEDAVIGHAVKSLSQDGEVKVNIPHRIYQIYGRQLSIVGADGSYSSAAVFFHKRRLYQIEGKVRSANNDDATFAAIRFQQSLTFTEGR